MTKSLMAAVASAFAAPGNRRRLHHACSPNRRVSQALENVKNKTADPPCKRYRINIAGLPCTNRESWDETFISGCCVCFCRRRLRSICRDRANSKQSVLRTKQNGLQGHQCLQRSE